MNMLPDEKDQKIYGKNLRTIREGKSLSQEDVAKMSKISTTHYAGIERGEENPTFSVIGSICKALKIKSSEVLPF
jgi:transcriptional regulator with XRE-family HTH domain